MSNAAANCSASSAVSTWPVPDFSTREASRAIAARRKVDFSTPSDVAAAVIRSPKLSSWRICVVRVCFSRSRSWALKSSVAFLLRRPETKCDLHYNATCFSAHERRRGSVDRITASRLASS